MNLLNTAKTEDQMRFYPFTFVFSVCFVVAVNKITRSTFISSLYT